MRLAEKKPESKKRFEMKKIHNMHGGMDTERRHEFFAVMAAPAPHVDKAGRVKVY